jgi:hypothetical protein
MELVILDNGFVFIIVFGHTVHSSHELFFLICQRHFLVLDRFRADLIIHDVIDVIEVVHVLGIEILVVQCVIDED